MMLKMQTWSCQCITDRIQFEYSDTAGILWFYFIDEANDFKVNITDVDDFKCLKYKAKLIGY